MTSTYTSRRRPRWGASLLVLGLAVGVAGCDELLQVDNPNNITGAGVLTLDAADALVNGALSGVADGFAEILTSYSTLTDELEWSGSRDAYTELDLGTASNPFNEFTDSQFRWLARSRWMADEADRILTVHAASSDPDSQLSDPENLGYAKMYAAIARINIANWYDDYVYSDKAEAGTPFGERFGVRAMSTVYDEAIVLLTDAIAIAIAEGLDPTEEDENLQYAALALRAKARHALAVWPVAQSPSGTGLVAAPLAVADAQAALALVTDLNTKYTFDYTSQTIRATIAGWVNSRQEMRIGPTYASPDPGEPTYEAVTLTDLIDVTKVSPELEREILANWPNNKSLRYPEFTMVSNRELHLIIAEDALANGDIAGFTTASNDLRSLDKLTDFVDGGAGMPTALALLIHSRQTNLFMQGFRLSDMYRFGITSPQWTAGSEAVLTPGVFFPIAVIECRANENLPFNC